MGWALLAIWRLLFGGCCVKSGVCITLKTNFSCAPLSTAPLPHPGRPYPLLCCFMTYLLLRALPSSSPASVGAAQARHWPPIPSRGCRQLPVTWSLSHALCRAGGHKAPWPELGAARWLAGRPWGSMPQPGPPRTTESPGDPRGSTLPVDPICA